MWLAGVALIGIMLWGAFRGSSPNLSRVFAMTAMMAGSLAGVLAAGEQWLAPRPLSFEGDGPFEWSGRKQWTPLDHRALEEKVQQLRDSLELKNAEAQARAEQVASITAMMFSEASEAAHREEVRIAEAKARGAAEAAAEAGRRMAKAEALLQEARARDAEKRQREHAELVAREQNLEAAAWMFDEAQADYDETMDHIRADAEAQAAYDEMLEREQQEREERVRATEERHRATARNSATARSSGGWGQTVRRGAFKAAKLGLAATGAATTALAAAVMSGDGGRSCRQHVCLQ